MQHIETFIQRNKIIGESVKSSSTKKNNNFQLAIIIHKINHVGSKTTTAES